MHKLESLQPRQTDVAKTAERVTAPNDSVAIIHESPPSALEMDRSKPQDVNPSVKDGTGTTEPRYRDPDCSRANPGFIGEYILSLLIAWGSFAVFFAILYFIGLSIRGNNFITIPNSQWGTFSQNAMPASLGSIQSTSWTGARNGPTYPLDCPLSSSAGVVCGSAATSGTMSMFPWIADKLGGVGSPLPGCAKAKAQLGFYMDPLPAQRCINGVPKPAMGMLKSAVAGK